MFARQYRSDLVKFRLKIYIYNKIEHRIGLIITGVPSHIVLVYVVITSHASKEKQNCCVSVIY